MDKPDLSAFRCNYINWDCQASGPELLLQAALSQAAEWEKESGHLARSLSYEVAGGQRFECSAYVYLLNRGAAALKLHLSLGIYRSQSVPELPPSTPTLEELVDAIIEEGSITDVNVTAMFSYPAASFRSVIVLPTPFPCADEGTAETIGMMIRVRDDEAAGKARYTNAISVGGNNDLFHSVEYKLAPPIGRGYIQESLELASSFSRRWVVAKEEARLGNV